MNDFDYFNVNAEGKYIIESERIKQEKEEEEKQTETDQTEQKPQSPQNSPNALKEKFRLEELERENERLKEQDAERLQKEMISIAG